MAVRACGRYPWSAAPGGQSATAAGETGGRGLAPVRLAHAREGRTPLMHRLRLSGACAGGLPHWLRLFLAHAQEPSVPAAGGARAGRRLALKWAGASLGAVVFLRKRQTPF